MLNFAPTSIFPLKYPKADSTLPPHGAKVVPVTVNFNGDHQATISLLDIQQQKDFDSLRCVWVDTRDSAQDVLFEVFGTGQRFSVIKGTSGYYPLIVLNNPQIVLSVINSDTDTVRLLFLNFIPIYSQGSSAGGSGPGSVVSVDNFPAIQAVNVNNFNRASAVWSGGLSAPGSIMMTATPSPLCSNMLGIVIIASNVTYSGVTINTITITDNNGLKFIAKVLLQLSALNGVVYQASELKIPMVSPYSVNMNVAITGGIFNVIMTAQ